MSQVRPIKIAGPLGIVFLREIEESTDPLGDLGVVAQFSRFGSDE